MEELTNIVNERVNLTIEEEIEQSKRMVSSGQYLPIFSIIDYNKKAYTRYKGFVQDIANDWTDFLEVWNKNLSEIEISFYFAIKHHRQGSESIRNSIEKELERVFLDDSINPELLKLLKGNLITSKEKEIKAVVEALGKFYSSYNYTSNRCLDSYIFNYTGNTTTLFSMDNLPFSGNRIELTPESKKRIKEEFFIERLRSPKQTELYNKLISFTIQLNNLKGELSGYCGYDGDILGDNGLIDFSSHERMYRFKDVIIADVLSVIPEEIPVI